MVERSRKLGEGYLASNGYPHTGGPHDVLAPNTAQPFMHNVQREIEPEGAHRARPVTRAVPAVAPAGKQTAISVYIRDLLGENY